MEETKKKSGRPRKITTDNITNENVKPVTPKITKKEKLVLSDSDELLVKSNVFGELIYINHKTGDETTWENQGEIQPMTVKDLKDMKAKQLMFFKENWISVIGSDYVDMETYSIFDIYESLQVAKYYKDSVMPTDIEDVFSWDIEKMKKYIKLMPATIRETIAVRANDKIKNGSLDSISKVKALEEILGCELASPTD